MKLYNFFRSSASYRLRIALALKGLDYEYVPVNLLAGEQASPAYRSLNPQGFVPALEADGQLLIQSPAIIEWLEERYPQPALLPGDAGDRAWVRAIAAIVACDIHPLHNGRILAQLKKWPDCDDARVAHWCRTWIGAGFDAIEELLRARATVGPYCLGNTVTVADVYLVPQVASSIRLGIDMAAWPRIRDVAAACAELDAFKQAMPGRQIDAPAA
ncbi:maleylacetoacetate isomerase [uncultured Azohydromonas sp.]|jgi:maleylacetoacetate isomerase|uniref:maleylacetoacetate isomerase n=1 Tax=uncultured Azohydromonas sp. TaxID=487342 RepID=UPI002636737A|nr:maleylacetoacetate isomerase [uncultured Azohydromonas sp.]